MITRPTRVLIVFILLTTLNWLYVLWVKYQFVQLINAWFMLTPLIGFFYFAFAFLAALGLYKKVELGLDLAYGVILFGSISVTISYLLVYNRHFLINSCILPLLLINLCAIIYLAMNRGNFRGE